VKRVPVRRSIVATQIACAAIIAWRVRSLFEFCAAEKIFHFLCKTCRKRVA